ncbi:hypothetical protein ACFL47_05590, partial [Candidatus Latescibacterota bacterium]
MKKRIFIPLLLLFLVVIIGGYFAVSRYYRFNQRTHDYFVTKASEYLGTDVEVSSVRILPWSMSLRDAHLTLQDIPVEISVDRIIISFDLFSFIMNKFEPLYGTEQVYLDHPEFIWVTSTDDSIAPEVAMKELPVFPVTSVPYTKININKGSLLVSNGDSTSVIADNLSGWMDGSNTSIGRIMVEGNVLSSKKNTLLKGTIDRSRNSFSVVVTSSNCDISNNRLGIVMQKTGIIPREGTMNIDFQAEQVDDKFGLNGSFSVENGFCTLTRFGVDIRDVNLNGTLNDYEIVFDNIAASMLEIDPHVSGKVTLFPEMFISMKVEANDVDISSVLKKINPDNESSAIGIIDFSATVQGPPGQISTDAEVVAESLKYDNHILTNFSSNFTVDHQKLTIKSVRALYGDYDLSAQGASSFKSVKQRNTFSINA